MEASVAVDTPLLVVIGTYARSELLVDEGLVSRVQ